MKFFVFIFVLEFFPFVFIEKVNRCKIKITATLAVFSQNASGALLSL